MLKDKNLITVKAITPKMAKQITILRFNWKDGSEYKTIWQMLALQQTKPLGWAKWEDIVGTVGRDPFWLVKRGPNVYWWQAPEPNGLVAETNEINVAKMYWPTIEQIFIG